MPSALEQALAAWLASGRQRMGEIFIASRPGGGFVLVHREDKDRDDLVVYGGADAAEGLAKFNDAGHYRPLRTSPDLQHGWRLEVSNISELRAALDRFYPGRLNILLAFEKNMLTTTPLRATLERQSGMYRVAAKISDAQSDELVGRFCRSRKGAPGCLRTILWKRDASGATASTQLPPAKFNPDHDQTGRGESVMPLLCQEPCNLLVAAAREIVKSAGST